MSTRQYIEEHTQTVPNNAVFTTKNVFVKNSLQVTIDGERAVYTTLGTNLVRLLDIPEVGSLVKLTYDVFVEEINTEVDVVKRILMLEEKVTRLEQENKLLAEAVEARVPAKTFRQWLLLMEKNFGKSVLGGTSVLGVQGDQIPSPK